jgi:hypothetical protein
MGGNLLEDWSGEQLEASTLIKSDLSLDEIRRKVESKNRREKINVAYRLGLYSANIEPKNSSQDTKLDTVITRLVKLNRTVKSLRDYTEVEG